MTKVYSTLRLIILMVAALYGIMILSINSRAAPSLALHYGVHPPLADLRAFDLVVLDPDHQGNLDELKPSEALAYASIGEVSSSRPYNKQIQNTWVLGENKTWGTRVLDQSNPDWQFFFLHQVIEPLWEAGYRGFFLDTLDSYQLFAKTAEDRDRQEAGLIQTIETLKNHYPSAKIILNRGFEILPKIYSHVFGVAAESLYGGWDQSKKRYFEIKNNDRTWLLNQLTKARDQYGVYVYSIDYAAPNNKTKAREYAQKIAAQGIEPYVTNNELDTVGIGRIELVARKVLIIQDDSLRADVSISEAARFGALPLHYLGYHTEYLHTQAAPPLDSLNNYAGVVVWLTGNDFLSKPWLTWIEQQRDNKTPIVFIADNLPVANRSQWGAQTKDFRKEWAENFIAETKNGAIGFEAKPLPVILDIDQILNNTSGENWLSYTGPPGQRHDSIAITGWGGYALRSQTLVKLPSPGDQDEYYRWVVDPIAFFAAALKKNDAPVPDVSTSNGLRSLMIHIDGDGFPSRAEFPGSPYASQVLLQQIFQKYELPTTMSIIQGEIATNGLYPKQSKELEAIARKMFRLPHIEPASHSYSHPFHWSKLDTVDEETLANYHLEIPNYVFDLEQEVVGSIEYINQSLLPPGKKAELLFWSGDTTPSEEVLRYTTQQGILNLNGGYTTLTRANPSLTLAAGFYINKNGAIQVFAPNQNENVYTNLWSGPFYGYERVIETFQLTESPRRLKPINIYYHTYAASKPASLKALHKVYRWAMQQSTHPIYASEYIRQVLDFTKLSIAKTEQGYQIRGANHLRTLRLPLTAPTIDWIASKNLAGEKIEQGVRYVHLSGDRAEIIFTQKSDNLKASQQPPYLWEANGKVESVAFSPSQLTIDLRSHVSLAWAIHHPDSSTDTTVPCRFRIDGKSIRPVRQEKSPDGGLISYFKQSQHAVSAFNVICPSP